MEVLTLNYNKLLQQKLYYFFGEINFIKKKYGLFFRAWTPETVAKITCFP